MNFYIANKKIMTANMFLLPIIYKIYYKIHENIKKLNNSSKTVINNNNLLQEKIKEKNLEIKTIEESCLSLDNWINEI